MEMEYLNNCTACGNDSIETIDEFCNICRCGSCGFIFDNPRPSADELIKFYSAPSKYDSWLSEEYERDLLWKRRIKKILRHAASGKLLDIGTGTGQFLHHAGKYFDVSGTEVSESAIRISLEKYNLKIIKGRIETQDTDISFNVITLFHVLEHVPYPKAILEKCRRILADRGIIVIALPNDVSSLKNRIKIILGRLGIKQYGRWGKIGLPKLTLDGSLSEIHISHFTQYTAAHLLKNSGFDIIESSPDPYFAKKGVALFYHNLYYIFNCILFKLFKINIYDAIWIVGRKRTD